MKTITILLLPALMAMAASAHAGVVLGGTRLIYPGSDREVTLSVANKGMAPALVQSWVDDGAADASPESSRAPFIVTPPITRIEPQQSQTLRVLFHGQPLPADRESLFWLNVLEVPPMVRTAGDRSLLQLAIQSRIKLFYRPSGIAVSLHEAAQALSWRVHQDGDAISLVSHNTSALHISFGSIRLYRSGRVLANSEGTTMVAPGGEVMFMLAPATTSAVHGQENVVEFEYINDYGALKTVRTPVGPR